MGLPAINLVCPHVLWRGHVTEVQLEVVVDHPIEVADIVVEVRGYDGWRLFGVETYVEKNHHYQLRHFVGRALLQADRHRFPIQIQVPRTMGPTHAYDPAFSHVSVLVKVKRPRFWRSDLVKRFWLRVREPPPFSIPRDLATARSEVKERAYLELSIASTHLVIGERLLGSYAVFHVDDAKPQTVRLSLVPELELFGGSTVAVREGVGRSITIEMPAGSAGIAQPFQFILPPDLTPTFKADTHALGWRFSARLGGIKASIPVAIYDELAASRTRPLLEVPVLADRRVAAMFATLEDAGWKRVALDGEDERFAITRRLGKSSLRIAYVYRGERGTFLVGRVMHRPLGLRLSVTRSSLVQQLFDGDIDLDIAGWDRKHFVMARYDDQARQVLQVAVPSLKDLPGKLVEWTDERYVLESSIAGLEAADLDRMVENLELVAATIERAREVITPPPGLEVDLDRWRELARYLQGELTVGDLSITGRLGHLPVALALEFDQGVPARATSVRVTVGDRDSASAAARTVTLRLARPNESVGEGHAGLSALLGAWPGDFVDLAIEDGVVSARCRLPRAIANAERAKDLVHALAAVRGVLDPSAAPYR